MGRASLVVPFVGSQQHRSVIRNDRHVGVIIADPGGDGAALQCQKASRM